MDQKDYRSVQPEQSLSEGSGKLWQPLEQGPAKVWVWVIVCLSMFIFTWHACTRMVAAGDTWVAMACGRHFINHGVDTVEPFSANSHHAGPTLEEIKAWPDLAKLMVKAEPEEIDLDLEKVSKWKRALIPSFSLETIQKWHPTGWVNQNWLTHVIFYWLSTTMGSEEEPFFNALVYWKFGIYALTVLAIFAMGRQLGLHPLNAAMAASMALFAGRSFLDVRPAGFSNLLVPTLILVWVLATYRNIGWIWLTVPIAVFWSNVHGGYIYVLIMMIPFVGLHLMASLPKRWTLGLYCCAGWLALFFISSKGLNIEGLPEPTLLSSKVFWLILLTSACGLALTWMPSQSLKTLIIYHVVACVVLFLIMLIGRLFPTIPTHLVTRQWDLINEELNAVRGQFIALYFAFVGLGVILTFCKPHLVTLKMGQVGHLIGAYIVTLIAVIVFNPFHLTNLTHTFVISVSEHAARWRMVHEWHPAFEWDNPVGTAWPFLIIFLVGLVAPLFWLISYIVAQQTRKSVPESQQEGQSFLKLDLPILLVAFFTIYMAYRSRRFIPIAGFVACPVLALLLQNTVDLWFSTLTTLRNNRDWVAKTHWRLEPIYVVVVLGLLSSIGFFALTKHFKQIDDNWFWFGTAHTQVLIQIIAVGVWVATAVVGCLQVMGKTTSPRKKVGMLLGVGSIPLVIAILSIKFGGRVGNMVVLFIAMAGIVYLSVLMIAREMKLQTESALARQMGRCAVKGSFHRAGVLVLLGFFLFVGSRVAIKYNDVYLKPWPQDPDYYSVFMRMTASHLKPFEACQFIRDNKLHGNMLNYWTEGGFIAYGQTPDPNSGKTPLQLFMDGRAQAAYDRKTFDLWSAIWAGVPGMSQRQAYQLQVKKNKTQKDFQIMGEAVVKELRKHDVWVALVPKLQFDSNFARALGSHTDWPVVYIDDKQKLFVDIRTEQGEKLFRGIAPGQTVYPNEYTRLMNEAFHKLTYMRQSKEQRQEGLEMAIKAFNMKPCDITAILLVNRAGNYPELKQEIAIFALDFIEDLSQKRDEYRQQNGYGGYLEAGWRLCGFLGSYKRQINNKPVDTLALQMQATDFVDELKTLSEKRRW